MSKKKELEKMQEQLETEVSRVKLPRNNESFGIVDQRLGASRMKVRCLDEKTRICRIPGRLKKIMGARRRSSFG